LIPPARQSGQAAVIKAAKDKTNGAHMRPNYRKECRPMKIAVSSTGPGLQDLVDPRFGRCRFYLIYDMDTGRHESRENTAGMH